MFLVTPQFPHAAKIKVYEDLFLIKKKPLTSYRLKAETLKRIILIEFSPKAL